MKTFPIYNGAKSTGKQWFTVKNLAAEPAAEILIYEEIGKDWWSGEGIGAKDFIDEVQQIPKGRKIVMRINSNGGNVHDGLAIYNYLQTRKQDVTCIVDGVAASIASIIALAGNSLEMPRNALMMIHEPWTMAQGNADEMRKAADALDKHRDSLVTIYEAKTGKSAADIQAAMKAETWFTGDEAKAFSLCDTVTEERPVMACAHLNFSNFRRVPDALKATTPQPAALGGAQKTNPKDTMNKEKIIALLKSNGIEVPADATEEQLQNLLSSAVKSKAPTPAPVAVEPNAALAEELKQIRAERDSQKRANIKNALTQCANEFRIPLNSVDGWVESCMKDEAILARVQTMEPKPPGAEPLNLVITSEAPSDVMKGIANLRKPMAAVCGRMDIDRGILAQHATAINAAFKQNRDKLIGFMNTSNVDSDLKRVVILNDMLEAFKRKIIALNAFSTVFQNVALQGTDEVVVPYYDLQTTTSTDYNASNGYVFSRDTTASSKKITVDKRKYQEVEFSSNTFRRQPYFNLQENVSLLAAQLGVDIFADVLSVVTAANFSTAVKTEPAAAFDVDDVIDIQTACDQADWPEAGRSLLLDSAYKGNLLKDPSLKYYMNAGDANALRRGVTGMIAGFSMYDSPRIPTNSENLVGMAVFKSAILVATAPIEPAPGVRNQLLSYDLVLDSDTGIGFSYRYGSDVWKDKDREVIEACYGYKTGVATALKRITSA